MSAALLLMAERVKLCRAAGPHGAYLDYIRDNGLALASLGDPDPLEWAGAFAVTTIRPTWDGSFEFVHPGEPKVTVAAVCEVFGGDAETVVDLVAWPVDAPERVRTMFGRAACLGAWNVTNAASTLGGVPLRVWRTPLRWLQEGAQGCVVLNPASAVRRLLDAPGRISGEDRDHSRELTALMAGVFDLSRIVAPVSPDLKEAA